MTRATLLCALFTGSLLLAACGATPTDTSGSAAEAADVSGTFALVAASSGKCADVTSFSTANGAPIQQWTCNFGQPNQTWTLSPRGAGVEIRSTISGKCLDVTDWNRANGTKMQQWDCAGTANQLWSLVPQRGAYAIRSVFSGACLDVTDFSVADGARLQQWGCAGSTNQTFALRPVGASGPGAPPPPPPPTTLGTTRLRIRNQCSQSIWLAHSDNVPDAQNVMLANGQSHDVAIPDGALSAARFWPKIGCDGSGHDCAMGDNGEGGGKPCPANGCQPPLDSKFEVSFAAKGSSAQTWYNLSQVDGYTLPFKVTPSGSGVGSGSCVASDCSRLSLASCPGDENMSGSGVFPAYAHEDLRVRDARGNVIACMAPCKKWNYPAPYGLGQSEGAEPGLHMCCPTPIDPASGQCTEANHCMTSPACNDAGDPLSVVHTSYVAAIHAMCPSAYSFAYDDAAGLHACPSDTGFEVVFCP
jgi:hypothetical protein